MPSLPIFTAGLALERAGQLGRDPAAVEAARLGPHGSTDGATVGAYLHESPQGVAIGGELAARGFVDDQQEGSCSYPRVSAAHIDSSGSKHR
jgi:hypothetical protein